jgi:hypothetical protein
MSGVMKAIGGMFAPKIPKAPKPEAPMAMPDPAAPAARLAARKKVEETRERGRAGTIYTGGSYSNQNLGGTS